MVKNLGNVLGLLQMEKRPKHPSPATIDKSTEVFKKIHSYSVKIPDNYFDVKSDPLALQHGKHISDDDKRKQLNELMDIYYQVEYNKMVANGQVQPAFTPNPFDNELNFTHSIDLHNRKKRDKLVHSIYKKDNQEQSTQTTSKPVDMGTQEQEIQAKGNQTTLDQFVSPVKDKRVKEEIDRLREQARQKIKAKELGRKRSKSFDESSGFITKPDLDAAPAPKIIPGSKLDLAKEATGISPAQTRARARAKAKSKGGLRGKK